MIDTLLMNNSQTTICSALLTMLLAFICGSIISTVFHLTNKSSKSYLLTLMVLPSVVAIIIMLVNGNIGAGLATAGAFSLVRFRSAAGSSKDILGIFMVMACGLTCGVGYGILAIIAAIFFSTILVILHMMGYGKEDQHLQLRILISEDLNYMNLFDDIFSTYTSYCHLTKAKTTNLGSLFELTYEITLKDELAQKEMLDALRVRNGNLAITLSELQPDIQTL